MRRKILLSPLALIALIVLGVGIAGAAIFFGAIGDKNSPAVGVNLRSGLVGWWRFDGDATDSSGNGRNATVYGPTLSTDRNNQVNKAYSFNGGGDYMEIPAISLPGSYSVSMWVKLNAYTGPNGTWLWSYRSNDLGPFLEVTGGSDLPAGRVDFSAGSGSLAGTSDILSLSTWYHLVGVYYTGTNIQKVYINGVEKVSVAGTGSLNPSSTAWLGKDRFHPTYGYLNGSMDDVRIYNRAINQAEVTALYQNSNPGIMVSDLQKGLVGNWKMDGNAKDSSPNVNHGTVTGATLTTDRKGQANKAYNFNGSSDYIQITDATSLRPSQLTLSVWFKSNDTTKTIVAKPYNTNSWSYGFHQAGTLQFLYDMGSGGAVDSGYTPPAGTWVHAVATYDGANIRIYVNGTQKAAPAKTGSILYDAAPLRIGSHSSTYPQIFNGSMDDVRIYNRALSQTEITALYQEYSGAGGMVFSDLQKGLVGQWKMDGNAKDSSPNVNHGTVTGAVFTTDRKGQANKAYSFNGTSAYIDAGSGTSLQITSTITLAAWVYHTSSPGNNFAVVYGSNGNYDYGLVWQWTTGKMILGLRLGGVWGDQVLSNAIPENTWVHIVGTYDGSRAKIYQNGALAGDNPKTGSITITGGNSFRVGYAAATDHWWRGKIDDVRVYNRALSATEVLALYQSY